jgi:exopolysaccharide biosynthesis polyprenyl glycosylphosphotransferase
VTIAYRPAEREGEMTVLDHAAVSTRGVSEAAADTRSDLAFEAPSTSDRPNAARRLAGIAGRYRLWPAFLVADLLALAVASAFGETPLLWVAVVGGMLVVLYRTAGLYRSRLSLSLLDDLPQLLGRALVAVAVGSAALSLSGSPLEGEHVLAGGLLVVVLLVLRALAYLVVRTVRARGWVGHRALVLGAGQVGGQIARLLKEHPEYGLRPVGFLDSRPLLPPTERSVPLLGGHDQLASTLSKQDIGIVIVAFASVPGSEMVDIIRTCDRMDAEIFFIPRLFELHAGGPEVDQVWGLPLVRLRRATFRTLPWRLKRGFDVVVAALALVLLSPLLLALALAVRLEGGPGVLFRQERVGLDGVAFPLLKFRSMRPDSEGESATRWSVADDERVGPVGRVLRRTSLDELPQLWNILRGEMTLVGPRPERPHFVAQFSRSMPRYTARHRVPAGLTGWAQVHGLRGDTSITDRARFDNHYIENWSLWGDVKILLRTLLAVLRRTGS